MSEFSKFKFCKVATMRREANVLEHDYLTENGWNATSSTPGSHWMFEKTVDGKTYLCSQADAARIQEHWNRRDYFDRHPEEMND